MPSQAKLIKQGIKYTDSLFKEISKRIEQGVKSSDTLEEFLANYNEYTNGEGENNPLVLSGYKDEMLKIILQETNNHKFSRPSQKELVRVTIENQVGELIVDVGEDIQRNVRDIVLDGYNNNLTQDEIAANISSKVSVIKNRRARTIARTEVARTATISDYVINAERGATHFYVECRNNACPICKEAWHKHWSKSNDDSFSPKETSAGGKGWIGDRVYSMSDTMMLPPVHPNCRCVPYFISEDDIPDGVSVEKPTPKPTETVTQTETETVTEPTGYQLNNRENSYSDVKITKEQFEKVVKHQSKRANAKLEFGNSIDNETGNLIHAKDIRGKKNTVRIPTSNRPYSVIHNHTNNGGFSGGDVYSHVLGNNQEVCYATTPNGIWIMRDTRQGTFSKREGFVSENTASELKYRMEGKFRELSQEVKAKYQSQYDNAKTREERVEIGQKVNNEVFTQYNDWILDEFAIGKRMDWLIEIEFIPKEKLKDVQF